VASAVRFTSGYDVSRLQYVLHHVLTGLNVGRIISPRLRRHRTQKSTEWPLIIKRLFLQDSDIWIATPMEAMKHDPSRHVACALGPPGSPGPTRMQGNQTLPEPG
jgi:hypothetical protein